MKIILNINPKVEGSDLINQAIQSASVGDTIIFPSGTFSIHSTIIVDKKISLQGDQTTITTTTNIAAIKISGAGIKPAIIDGIDLFNSCATSDSDGVVINGITWLKNSWIKNFGGNGITVSADLAHSKTNCSFSRFDNLTISGCKGHGMYFQGGDANQCNSYHIDIRDNGGHGIYDHSFLGNQFFGCMAHNNKMGNYCADDPNNRAGFYGCYSEQGSAPEILGGACTWHGGLPSNGFKLSGFAKTYYYK